MRVLGIDPGSETTGWGVVEGDSNGQRYHLIEFGAIKSPSSATFSARLLRICRALEEVIERLQPDACAIEEAFYSVNPKVTLKLGQVRGVALLVGERLQQQPAAGQRAQRWEIHARTLCAAAMRPDSAALVP